MGRYGLNLREQKGLTPMNPSADPHLNLWGDVHHPGEANEVS